MKRGNVNPKFLKNNDEKVARGKMTEINGVCAKKTKNKTVKKLPKSRQNSDFEVFLVFAGGFIGFGHSDKSCVQRRLQIIISETCA